MIPDSFASYAGPGGAASIIVLALIFFILRPKRRTKLDAFIFWFGNVSIVLVVVLAVLSQVYKARNWDNYIFPVVLAYVVLLLLAGIRYLGDSNHVNGFGRQVLDVLSKLFLWLFLPAGLITGILLALSYIFRWGQ